MIVFFDSASYIGADSDVKLFGVSFTAKKTGHYLDDYRTFCNSPQAEICFEMFTAIPVAA